MPEAVFYYDTNSPYAYLAAFRIDEVLPVKPEWRPISFGVIVRRTGKVPWSFTDEREAGLAEISRRASERGMPEVRIPGSWPVESHSLAPLRALSLIDNQELRRVLSRELYRTMFVDRRPLSDLEAVLDSVERAGLDRAEVAEGIERQEVKDRLRDATDAALERGVTGVPTVAIGDQLFWGDDRLEDAAAAMAR